MRFDRGILSLLMDADAFFVMQIFFLFLIVKSLVEAYLDKRNKSYVRAHRDSVPDPFVEKIGIEDHRKAADYTVAKTDVGRFFGLVDTVALLAWTMGGGIGALDRLVSGFGLSQTKTGLAFFGIFFFISFLIGLPRSLYGTFVVEERFGFNKTTVSTFVADTAKGIALSILLGFPILYGVLSIMEYLGGYWWIYAWAFLTLVQFALVWAYPRFIAPLFNKFAELSEGETKQRVLELLAKTGFKSNGLFVMDASRRSAHGNAYFTGFGKNKRIVFFDNLIESLEAEEVEAVLAHELGHFKRRHILKGMIKSVVFSFIGFAVLGYLMNYGPFYVGHGVSTSPSTYTALCLFFLVSEVYTFPLIPLNSWVSRKWEFEADRFAVEYAKADKLVSALVKLYRDNAGTLTPDPLYSSYYHSHPPALIRVEHLERAAVS